ncbi:hypothetical protein TNCV_2470831 [Trichonephila clavipes]|nr:hypothetical protein TNCV_2470831 [Trichonephila clavipes]
MVKISAALRFRIPFNELKLPRRRIRARYEQLSEFERSCIVELKKAAQRYVNDILRTVLQSFLSEDKAIPHVTRVTMNNLTAFQTLPCPVRSPNLSPIE